MVKKAPQIHTDDLHVCESNFVKYKNLNSVGVSGIFFYQIDIFEIYSLFNTSFSYSPPPKKKDYPKAPRPPKLIFFRILNRERVCI